MLVCDLDCHLLALAILESRTNYKLKMDERDGGKLVKNLETLTGFCGESRWILKEASLVLRIPNTCFAACRTCRTCRAL